MADLDIGNVIREINKGLEMARKSGVVCGPAFNVRVLPAPVPRGKD